MSKKLIGIALLVGAAVYYLTPKKKAQESSSVNDTTSVDSQGKDVRAIIEASGAPQATSSDPVAVPVKSTSGTSTLAAGDKVRFGNSDFIVSRVLNKYEVALAYMPPATGWITAQIQYVTKIN